MKVDFLDSAFATLHIGLIGFDFDIFRAEFCFKTGIEYELNTLKVSENIYYVKLIVIFLNVTPVEAATCISNIVSICLFS